MNENMEFPGAAGDYIEWLQNSFVKVIQTEIKNSHENHFIPREDRGKVRLFIIFIKHSVQIISQKVYFFNPTNKNLQNLPILLFLQTLFTISIKGELPPLLNKMQ